LKGEEARRKESEEKEKRGGVKPRRAKLFF